jgi:regulation of enolase protein 1 (concanavalin A-like superfamily)
VVVLCIPGSAWAGDLGDKPSETRPGQVAADINSPETQPRDRTLRALPPQKAEGRFAGALVFDGTDYFGIGNPSDNHLDLGANATLETWVRFDALPDSSFATLLGKDEGRFDQNKWIFAYAQGFAGIENATGFHINSPTTGSIWLQSNSWTPVIGQWYHLAVVKNGNQYTFYRNGQTDGTASTTAAAPCVNCDLLLGQSEGSFGLQGAMSDVRLWNSALTANQIQTRMNKELTGTETGLAGHWICTATAPEKVKTAPSPEKPGPSNLLRDDFHGKYALNWKIIREDKDHLSLTKNPGHLTITTQRGTIHGDVAHDAVSEGIRAKNIFLIRNPLAADGDFSITLAVSKFEPTTYYQQVGLICYDDDDNYVKWSYEYSWMTPNTTNFVMVRQTKMVPEHDLVVELPNPGEFWMRITKRGDQYECAYSTDGHDFKVAGARPWGNRATKYFGFLAKNGGNPQAGEIDVCIDSFELRSSPAKDAEVIMKDEPKHAEVQQDGKAVPQDSRDGAATGVKPTQDPQRAARLKLLRQWAEKWQVSVVADGKPTQVKMLPEPLYRYKRESQHYPDAVVWAWGDGGRPAALLTLICHVKTNFGSLNNELASLSPHPLVGTMDGQERWSPQVAGLNMKPLPNAPPPAVDEPGRLRQISELTARMQADEVAYQSEVGKTPKPQKVDLAWLPQPVYRYADPAHGTIDGAICFACVETDPEVLLVLEAQRRGDSPPAWYYGFNRAGKAELHVRFDDKELWTAPRLIGTTPRDPYHFLPVLLTGR